MIRAVTSKREQTTSDFTTFANAPGSRYESGLLLYIRRPNFNSANNPNDGLVYVRVSGPGLPTNGIVLADVQATLPQDWMGILNTTGTIPTGTQQFAGLDAGSTGNIFTLQRTVNITGTQAFTLRPNPNVGNNNTFVTIAHPTMYGQSTSNTWQADVSGVVAWAQYTFEAFDGTSTVPGLTWTQRILTPLIPANSAGAQQWHNFGTSSRAFVTAGATAVASVTMDWSINSLAERPRNGFVFSSTYASNTSGAATTARVNSATARIPNGASSVTMNAVDSGDGGNYLPIVLPTTNSRTLQMDHTMLDGSSKINRIQFN